MSDTYQYGQALSSAAAGAFVFNDWLLDPRNQRYRATLIEIHADSGLYRLATQPYFQPDAIWDDLLIDEVIVESALDASVSVGDFTFSDDYRAHWGSENFYGRPCRVWLGDTRWARSAFVQIADLVIDHIKRKDDGVFSVAFTDALPLLEEKIIGLKVNGQPIPVVYGSPRNVSPIMTDYLTRTYRFSESALTAISTVRDRGKTPATITKLLPAGSVKIGVNVAGTITGDVTATPTYLRDVVASLLTRAGIATTAASITMRRFPAAYPNGYPLDIYIDDQPTYRDLLQTICEACGASLAREANGTYSLTYVTLDGMPSLTLTSDDILEISEESREPVYKQITINYNKNYTVQSASELAGGVSMADVKKYGSDYYGTLTATTNYGGSLHDGTLTHDILSGQAEAQAEAERLAERYAVPRRKWRISATQTAINVQVGDLITIADPALSSVVLVVAVSKNNTDLTADLECIA
jgi:hypothetical protein